MYWKFMGLTMPHWQTISLKEHNQLQPLANCFLNSSSLQRMHQTWRTGPTASAWAKLADISSKATGCQKHDFRLQVPLSNPLVKRQITYFEIIEWSPLGHFQHLAMTWQASHRVLSILYLKHLVMWDTMTHNPSYPKCIHIYIYNRPCRPSHNHFHFLAPLLQSSIINCAPKLFTAGSLTVNHFWFPPLRPDKDVDALVTAKDHHYLKSACQSHLGRNPTSLFAKRSA